MVLIWFLLLPVFHSDSNAELLCSNSSKLSSELQPAVETAKFDAGDWTANWTAVKSGVH